MWAVLSLLVALPCIIATVPASKHEAEEFLTKLFNSPDLVAHGTSGGLYGETGLEAIADSLNTVHAGSQDVFVDLGSGNGKINVAASLLYNFKKSVGYESSAERHEQACKVLDKMAGNSTDKGLVPSGFHGTLEFHNGDFTQASWSDADIVFGGLLPDEELQKTLAGKFRQMKNGARILMLREIRPDYLDGIKMKGKKEQSLGWSKAHPVFQYETDASAKPPSKEEQKQQMFDKHPELAKIFAIGAQAGDISAENKTGHSIDTNSLLTSLKKMGEPKEEKKEEKKDESTVMKEFQSMMDSFQNNIGSITGKPVEKEKKADTWSSSMDSLLNGFHNSLSNSASASVLNSESSSPASSILAAKDDKKDEKKEEPKPVTFDGASKALDDLLKDLKGEKKSSPASPSTASSSSSSNLAGERSLEDMMKDFRTPISSSSTPKEPSDGLKTTLSNIDKIFANAQNSLSVPKSSTVATSLSSSEPSAISAFSAGTRQDFHIDMGMDKMDKAQDSLRELMAKIRGSSFLQQDEETEDEVHVTAEQRQTATGRTVFVYTKVGEPQAAAPVDGVQVDSLIDAGSHSSLCSHTFG